MNGQSLVDVAGPMIEHDPTDSARSSTASSSCCLPAPGRGGVLRRDRSRRLGVDRRAAHRSSVEVLRAAVAARHEDALWAIPQYHIVLHVDDLAHRDRELMERARAEGRFWEIDTGHDLMITEPEAVTAALLEIAVQLELLNFPVGRFQRARQHAPRPSSASSTCCGSRANASATSPAAATRSSPTSTARFTGYRATMDMLDGLVEQGVEHADVPIPVFGDPEERATAVQALADLLDEIDAYCESGGQLLTIVTPPDLREFRTWLFAEVIGQMRGATPSPWTHPGPAATEPTPAPRDEHESFVVRESGALDLGDAARVRETLQSAYTASEPTWSSTSPTSSSSIR